MGNVVRVSADKDRMVMADPLYQFDYGQRLIIDGIELPNTYEVHFSNAEYGDSTTSLGDNTGVDIPDAYLTTGKDVYAWLYLHTGAEDGETVFRFTIPVRKRAKITDAQPTPVQQDVITQAIAALNTAVVETEADALEAEGYAVGTQNGTPVGSGSPYYENNAKYYSEQAGSAAQNIIDDTAGDGVTNKTWSANKLYDTFGTKANVEHPLFTGSISMGRKAGSTKGTNSVATGSDVIASMSYAHAEGYKTNAGSVSAHAEGNSTTAAGTSSHAEGSETYVSGNSAHAEGKSTIASGNYSHTEGESTSTNAPRAHAEGYSTTASGDSAHAEGRSTISSGDYSHAEGYSSKANGGSAHAEGIQTTASGGAAHAEGQQTTASGDYSHAEGHYTSASWTDAHAEGYQTKASGFSSHAEGENTTASGTDSHAEGNHTTSSGYISHAEGTNTTASGSYSHAEGRETSAQQACSHAEGRNTIASGESSHAEGYGSKATIQHSHAEGYYTEATNAAAHAEGYNTRATGAYSHAEGYYARATNTSAHAEGYYTEATGYYSHAEGYFTNAFCYAEHAGGLYNIPSKAEYLVVPENPEEFDPDKGFYPTGSVVKDNDAIYIAHMNCPTKSVPPYANLYNWHEIDPPLTEPPTWDPDSLYAANDNVKMSLNGKLYYYQCHNAVTYTVFYPHLFSVGWHTQPAGSTFGHGYCTLESIGDGGSNFKRNARVLDESGNEYLSGDLYVRKDGYSLTDKGKRVAIAAEDSTNGHLATLDAEGNLTDSGKAPSDYILASLKGAANGVAELDSNGRVPSAQLPSYVDDIVEGYYYNGNFYSDSAHTTQITPENGKIYVDLTSNKTYRWGGSEYVEISASLALGETSSTAYRGDRGKTAYDHATDANRLTTATANGLYKVGATADGHISSLTAVTKGDITALGIQETIYVASTTETQAIITEYVGVSA